MSQNFSLSDSIYIAWGDLPASVTSDNFKRFFMSVDVYTFWSEEFCVVHQCANPIKTFQKEFDLENSAVLHLNFPYLLGKRGVHSTPTVWQRASFRS